MRRITFFILIIGVLLCFVSACKNKHEKKLVVELRRFKEKTITLPDNMIAKSCDEQVPPDTTLLCCPLKMVVYVNQDGCQRCKLWSLLPIYMFILENQYLVNFGVVIILNTSDMETAYNVLTEMRFCKTVFYDLNGTFEHLNPHLPANEQFHTFLLNEDNRIVLVGNPVQNEQLKKLYLNELNKK